MGSAVLGCVCTGFRANCTKRKALVRGIDVGKLNLFFMRGIEAVENWLRVVMGSEETCGSF
jgi:hypothetical protein